MNNIEDVQNCFGCGVCATSCSKDVIDIRLNTDGFYVPHISQPDKCIDCGLCRKVCAFLHPNLAPVIKIEPKAYAGWSNESGIRQKSTSGGVAFEIGRYALGQGYKVCGVRFNAFENKAEHYISSNLSELQQSTGSKYLQSYTLEGFKSIDRTEKNLVFGTPCQIDSMRRMLQCFRCEDNFILVDFFCHGVPSMLAWEKYTKWASDKVGKILQVSWRNKDQGWHSSYNMHIVGENGEIRFSRSQGDLFLNLFLGDCCLGPQCYKDCKYKYDQSSADIRIGDFWGSKFRKDDLGVNSVIAFTDKGEKFLSSLDCTFIEQSLEVVTEGQLKHNAINAKFTDKVWRSLKNPAKDIHNAAQYPLRELTKFIWKGRINHILRICKINYQIK